MTSDDDVLGMIDELQGQRGHSPSYQEIADALGVTEGAVRKRLIRLREAGEVTWAPGKRRTLRVSRADAKGQSWPV